MTAPKLTPYQQAKHDEVMPEIKTIQAWVREFGYMTTSQSLDIACLLHDKFSSVTAQLCEQIEDSETYAQIRGEDIKTIADLQSERDQLKAENERLKGEIVSLNHNLIRANDRMPGE